MKGFQKKQIENLQTLGDRLRSARTSAGLSLHDVARACGFDRRYISYLEKGLYRKLPGGIYTENFLKKYARLLGYEIPEILRIYKNELRYVKESHALPQTKFREKRFIVTPTTFRGIIIILVSLVIVAYIVWELYSIFLPPRLIILYPEHQLILNENQIEIRGQTEPESTVMINNQEVYFDQEGYFYEVVPLDRGVNVIEIRAFKKHSRPNVIRREILVQDKQ